MAKVLDCRRIAQEHFDWAAAQAKVLRAKPCLATVLYAPAAGPDSRRYRDLIVQDAARLGVEARNLEPAAEPELLGALKGLNSDPAVTGIVVLYPLKAALPDEDVMDAVSPAKDVEGLNSLNLGYLIKYKRWLDAARGLKCVVPATAKAVVKTLQAYPEINIRGAFVCIINNSMRVGKPLGLMLENLGATVVKCYDKTPPQVMENCVRAADIVVTAVPDQKFTLDPSWIKGGAVIVDVSFQGNVDLSALDGRVSHATASDNRIGQVTRAMMFVNLVYCAQSLR